MDLNNLLDNLNAAQRQAVCAPMDNVLVLAGAGSGKTRVLVQRIGYLVGAERVSPYGIMALTFTNKAAKEIKTRAGALLDMPISGMWFGTFHSIAHRLLRLHYQARDLSQHFQIIDSADQQRLIKRLIANMALDVEQFPVKEVQWYINHHQEQGVMATEVQDAIGAHQRILLALYHEYQQLCARQSLVDFAMLQVHALLLLKDTPELCQHYRQRFAHVLVDEFQDTNQIQYHFLQLLLGKTGKIFAVGDDDQSIYGWRGAKVENMFNLKRDFAPLTEIKLEQNYRSSGHILNAANALIRHNDTRLGKDLWTDAGNGQLIDVFCAFNEIEEARYVGARIEAWQEQGKARQECAILYRSNAQSRLFEEEMIRRAIPYKVYGGLRFFERAEIKDALAYMRVAHNVQDDASLERIINMPPRGIGERTVDAVRQLAKAHNISLWQAANQLAQTSQGRVRTVLAAFIHLIESLQQKSAGLPLGEHMAVMVKGSGLYNHYKQDKADKGEAKAENLEELIGAAISFEQLDPSEYQDLPIVDAFLAHAVLESGEQQGEKWQDCVQLMTLHSAKGLEFAQVFLVGLEDGLFPHNMSLDEEGRLEEERRLCYVGITRAREQLLLSYAQSRRLYGKTNQHPPSRFLAELPAENLNQLRSTQSGGDFFKAHASARPAKLHDECGGFAIGQSVKHAVFGEGVIQNCEGNGEHARVQVHFDDIGSKWLVLAYANLQSP